MPCCMVTNPPMASNCLRPHCEVFSQYAANGNPVHRPTFPTHLASALHVEMLLWPASGRRFHPKFSPNNAFCNAWRAMTSRGVRAAFPLMNPHVDIWQQLEVPFDIPVPTTDCGLNTYDQWLLKLINNLRTTGRDQPNAMPPTRSTTPSQLITYGLSQKLVNIYVKYLHSWDIVGQYDVRRKIFLPPPRNPSTLQFTCALHAPIDREMLINLDTWPLGDYLRTKRLIINKDLVQANGFSTPWTKLDCLRTYYGFQIILRRLAMHSWPNGCGCGCIRDLILASADMFNKEFIPPGNGPDWVNEATCIPDDVFLNTLKYLRQ